MDDIAFLLEARSAKRKFSLWPRQCRTSGKRIWMKFGYRVRCTEMGWDMDEYNIDRWYSPDEFIMLKLKA